MNRRKIQIITTPGITEVENANFILWAHTVFQSQISNSPL